MTSLRELVAAELAEPVDPRVSTMAAAIAARYPGAARAVLFYGSCLRSAELDGMLDFYLIVASYRDAYGRSWLAFANRLIPPNVFLFEYEGLVAKYAVLDETDFRREIGEDARSVSVWARFAQPSRLVWCAGPAGSQQVVEVVAKAAPTLFRHTLPVMPAARHWGVQDIWRHGFSLTYGAELRAETAGRSATVVAADPGRYQRFGDAAMAEIALATGGAPHREATPIASPAAMQRRWRRMQRKGKLLSILRLAKASGTFAGGIDYLAWKINRHAGAEIAIAPWQRRWPLLGALTLLPRLLRRGAIR